MGIALITAPATLPVTTLELRRQCRIHESDAAFDALLDDFRADAIAKLDGPSGELGRALEPQVWELSLDAFADTIVLPLRPLISVDAVTYLDADGVEQVLDGAIYVVDLTSFTPRLVREQDASWPETFAGINAVRVRFTAGYPRSGEDGVNSGVPKALQGAIKLDVQRKFDPPRTSVEAKSIDDDYERAIGPYRVVVI